VTPHFTRREFDCKCGRCAVTGYDMRPAFVERLETARVAARMPFVITSGMRCEGHNRAVGGVDSSSHTRGWAADIACRDSGSRMRIVRALLGAGFTRVGIARTFVHVDADPDLPPEVVWVY
jgi:zinc D-Ala-D-Ala carboxypeptidase